jgi:hypothetical protein
MTLRNIGQIVYFKQVSYRLSFDFPTHLLHFSQWGKMFEKCGDLIWDRTNQGYLYGSMATSTKIKYQSLLYYVIYERSFNIYVIKLCNRNLEFLVHPLVLIRLNLVKTWWSYKRNKFCYAMYLADPYRTNKAKREKAGIFCCSYPFQLPWQIFSWF